MDKFNENIIIELRKNARVSVSDIAKRVNLSRSAVAERIKKMEHIGVIKGYQVLLSESLKDAVSVYFEIQMRQSVCVDVVGEFLSIPEIVSCKSITGDMDLLIYIKADTMRRVHEIREFLENQEDVSKIKTHVVMTEWMDL